MGLVGRSTTRPPCCWNVIVVNYFELMSNNINLEELLAAGVHFGHQTRKWHPKMKPYIFGKREGFHIIDLVKTKEQLEEAISFLQKTVEEEKAIVFVGTKRQAAAVVEAQAKKAGVSYITNRWIGGILTNFESIQKTLQRLGNYEKRLKDAAFEKLSTRDKFKLKKEYARSQILVGGIANLEKRPDLLIIVDPGFEKSAVSEANTAGIPIIALMDTNSDPTKIEIPIPGNDDALKSIEIILGLLTEAIIEAKKLK